MRTYDLTFDGINQIRMVIDYRFFLILSDEGSPIDIAVRKNSGFDQVKGVQAGFGTNLSGNRGQEFIFDSAVAQNVKIFVGDDEAIYNRLSGTVTVNGGTLATLTSITNPVKTLEGGQDYGTAWRENALAAAGTYQTVFTPAANVNGVLIHELRFITSNSTFTPMYNLFVAKAGLPASGIDGEVILTGDGAISGMVMGKITSPLKIKAGLGLYFFATHAEQTHSMKMALYTIL